MPAGLADMYEQLRTQIGLPTDTCTNPQKSSVAQLRIKWSRSQSKTFIRGSENQ